MGKSSKKDNTLIKRKNLHSKMNDSGINRISSEVLPFFESILESKIGTFIDALKDQLIIEGKKTLEKKDVKNVLEELEKEERFWEI